MLVDEGKIPSRSALLSMVKIHSELLGQTTADEGDPSDGEIDPRFWHDVMDLYFVRGRDSRGRQDDDLLFFVRKTGLHGFGFNDNIEDKSPYFVCRWAPKVKFDDLIGEKLIDVDWRRSFYLNLIAHTSYSVTVAICRIVINLVENPNAVLTMACMQVVRTVYASPSRISFHLDSRKEEETRPAYPDICFAVDDFDSTFGAVVLTDVDQCYCVLLNAHDGAAFVHNKIPQDCSSGNSSSQKSDNHPGRVKSSKITLFSGFVSYQMVRDAYDAGRSGFGSLLSLGHSSNKTERLYMKGPGGRGEVEVAVSGIIDQSKLDLDNLSQTTQGLEISTIVRKAASVASVAAKHAYAAAAATWSSDEGMLPLKCCLMSISLPWEHIAHDLLFKISGSQGNPPVNL